MRFKGLVTITLLIMAANIPLLGQESSPVQVDPAPEKPTTIDIGVYYPLMFYYQLNEGNMISPIPSYGSSGFRSAIDFGGEIPVLRDMGYKLEIEFAMMGTDMTKMSGPIYLIYWSHNIYYRTRFDYPLNMEFFMGLGSGNLLSREDLPEELKNYPQKNAVTYNFGLLADWEPIDHFSIQSGMSFKLFIYTLNPMLIFGPVFSFSYRF